jgi:hypothetical protein
MSSWSSPFSAFIPTRYDTRLAPFSVRVGVKPRHETGLKLSICPFSIRLYRPSILLEVDSDLADAPSPPEKDEYAYLGDHGI